MKRDPVVLIVVSMAAALMLLFGVYMAHHRAAPGAEVISKSITWQRILR